MIRDASPVVAKMGCSRRDRAYFQGFCKQELRRQATRLVIECFPRGQMGEALGSVYRDRVIGKRNADALKQGSGGLAIRRALGLPVGQRRQRSGHPPGGVRVRRAKALDGLRSTGEVVLIQGLK